MHAAIRAPPMILPALPELPFDDVAQPAAHYRVCAGFSGPLPAGRSRRPVPRRLTGRALRAKGANVHGAPVSHSRVETVTFSQPFE